MGHRKINFILLIVLLVLLSVFGWCIYYSTINPMFSFLNTISAISSFFVAILTIIYVYTTSNQMDLMKKQLEEMRIERLHREEPILDIKSPSFTIERPRFYYTPPEDKFSYLSRYYFYVTLNNISSYPAVFVDVSASLVIMNEDEENVLVTTSRRINVIPSNTTSHETRIMFTGDSESRILSELRNCSYDSLPHLRVCILYRSASGGCYKMKQMYVIDYLNDESDDEEIVKNWHTSIVTAPVKDKEALHKLENKIGRKPNYTLFKKVEEDFDKRLIGGDELMFQLVEETQGYMLEIISEEAFMDEINNHHYGHYIGTYQRGVCSAMKNDSHK